MKKIFSIVIALLATHIAIAQDFAGSFKMLISGDEVKQPVEMTCYYKDQAWAMQMSPEQMKGGKVRIVYDAKTKDTYTLMDMNGNKMGFKGKAKDIEDMIKDKAEPKITQTNETKTIDGHPCKKVITETDDSLIDMWVAQDMNFNLQSIFANMKSSKGGGSSRNMAQYAKYFKGPSLETLVTDKKKGTKTTMLIKEIKKGDIPEGIFSTEGYQIMDSPMGGMGKE
ncbi:DUF4412 domain-containing protein [Solitalea sp. MAHUQ-68]|uniref:DUF4412 domain-containing protein n=1 Tax=Solitalea agri TaxID=2953739 RepID=A0A9X2F2W2_9SPHI|nr:DUF4412 domain-containing protein [Solitalea agri]MCO4293226.1 DUF4412 domain-containing protein [Solitalea agri]